MVKRNHRPQTRWDKAESALNAISSAVVILERGNANQNMILMTMKALGMLTTYITLDHLEDILGFKRDKLLYHLQRMRGQGLVVMEGQFVELTREGVAESRILENGRSKFYKHLLDRKYASLTENLTKHRNNK